MEGKHGYSMPKPKSGMSYSKGPKNLMANSIRAANLKRMGKKGMKHNPGY